MNLSRGKHDCFWKRRSISQWTMQRNGIVFLFATSQSKPLPLSEYKRVSNQQFTSHFPVEWLSIHVFPGTAWLDKERFDLMICDWEYICCNYQCVTKNRIKMKWIEPPIQLGWCLFWCNSGAIGMERIDFMPLTSSQLRVQYQGGIWTRIESESM